MEKLRFDVLTAKVKNEKVFWTCIGKAYENETNIKIEFNALPIANPNGDIFVYLKKEKKDDVQKANESEKVRQAIYQNGDESAF